MGSLHVVPADQKINLMEENGKHSDKPYDSKIICCTFVSGYCKFIGFLTLMHVKYVSGNNIECTYFVNVAIK